MAKAKTPKQINAKIKSLKKQVNKLEKQQKKAAKKPAKKWFARPVRAAHQDGSTGEP